MNRFIPSFAFVFISLFSFAQYENFDLSKYKLPDIKRHQLDFGFDSDGEYQSSNKIVNYYAEPELQEYKRSDFRGSGNINYSFFGNSAKFKTDFSANTRLGYSRVNNSENGISEDDYFDFNSYLSIDYDVKYFPGKQNWFINAQPYTYARYSKDKDYIDDTNFKDKGFRSALGLGGGKGRIERVQDFRHAILLLNELEKRKVAKRVLSNEELGELSNLISALKNKRFFDARKRKEADLIAIDSFFVTKGIVDNERSITYFVGMEDIWTFGSLQVRESGKQLKLIVTPGYNLSLSVDDYDRRLEIFDINAGLDYLIRKPISIKWQSDFDFSIKYEYTNKLEEKWRSSGAKKHFSRAYSKANIGYFPNTRTSLYFSTQIALQNSSDVKLFDDENYAFRFYLATSFYYYLSERFRLGGYISYSANVGGVFNNTVENSGYDLFRYDLRLNYAIF